MAINSIGGTQGMTSVLLDMFKLAMDSGTQSTPAPSSNSGSNSSNPLQNILGGVTSNMTQAASQADPANSPDANNGSQGTSLSQMLSQVFEMISQMLAPSDDSGGSNNNTPAPTPAAGTVGTQLPNNPGTGTIGNNTGLTTSGVIPKAVSGGNVSASGSNASTDYSALSSEMDKTTQLGKKISSDPANASQSDIDEYAKESKQVSQDLIDTPASELHANVTDAKAKMDAFTSGAQDVDSAMKSQFGSGSPQSLSAASSYMTATSATTSTYANWATQSQANGWTASTT